MSGGEKESFTDAYRLTISCIRVSLGVFLHVFLSPLSRLHTAHNSQHPRVDILRNRVIIDRNRYNFHFDCHRH